MRTHSCSDRPAGTLQSDVWALILDQVSKLQAEMKEVGYLTMKGESWIVDGQATAAGIVFMDESGQRQSGQAMDFEEDVCLITLNMRAQSFNVDEDVEDAPSFQDAADYLMNNVATYMAAVTPAEQMFTQVDVVLSAADGLTITVDRHPEPWAHPGVIDTPEALRDFFEAETASLSERIGTRYIAYAQTQLDAWNANWPEANFTLGLINGSTLLEADLPDGRRQLLNHWRDDQIDAIFDGLTAQFEALRDLEGALESRIMPAISGTLLTTAPEPVVDLDIPDFN